jgi:hypothetical protein
VTTSAVARRLRQSVDIDAVTNPMKTVVCGKCGQRFIICNDHAVYDARLTEKRIAWIQGELVWDHIQERRHHALLKLPNLK